MSVSLLMPVGFRDRRRQEIYLWVMNRWRQLFPDWQICEGHDDPADYNRSKARNDAFRQADGDILVITDADTATTPGNIRQAIDTVKHTRAWVIAHSSYYSLTEEYTDQLLQEAPHVELIPPYPSNWIMRNKSEAGVLVMPREAYEAVEGYNERFNGWGWEDNAMASSLNRKWGQAQRTTGSVVHLWHPRGLDFDQPHIKFNEALYEEIRREI